VEDSEGKEYTRREQEAGEICENMIRTAKTKLTKFKKKLVAG
jgi:hypothetical protein